jgi:hypothetical protein
LNFRWHLAERFSRGTQVAKDASARSNVAQFLEIGASELRYLGGDFARRASSRIDDQ